MMRSKGREMGRSRAKADKADGLLDPDEDSLIARATNDLESITAPLLSSGLPIEEIEKQLNELFNGWRAGYVEEANKHE